MGVTFVNNKLSMKEVESWEILVSLSENEISIAEAHNQILRLFSVVGRSEQLRRDENKKHYEKGWEDGASHVYENCMPKP